MSHHTAPTPHNRQPSPHFVWQHYLHPFERDLLYGWITIPILKNKGETCMVQEPSHVKQLYPIHVCKIGLIKRIKLFCDIILKRLLTLWSGSCWTFIYCRRLGNRYVGDSACGYGWSCCSWCGGIQGSLRCCSNHQILNLKNYTLVFFSQEVILVHHMVAQK